MRLRPGTLLLLTLLSAGCTSNVVLNPIEKTDIFSVGTGVQCGEVKTEKQGWFLSDEYVTEIMNVKIKK